MIVLYHFISISLGFIAIVGDVSNLKNTIYTALPTGDYCDVISGNYEDGMCTGEIIHVVADGNGYFEIQGTSEDPVIAIHICKYKK